MLRTCAVLILVTGFGLSLSGQTPTMVVSLKNGGLIQNGYSGSVGLLFDVNQSVSVTQVGYWDGFGDGVQMATPISVAIFARSSLTTGSVISSTRIDFTGTIGTRSDTTTAPATLVADSFRVADLSAPVTLTPGAYALVAWGFDVSGAHVDHFINLPSAANFSNLGGALTYVESRHTAANIPDGAFPETFDFDSSQVPFVAGTFVATAIPEPAGVTVLVGLAGLLFCMIRRTRSVQALT